MIAIRFFRALKKWSTRWSKKMTHDRWHFSFSPYSIIFSKLDACWFHIHLHFFTPNSQLLQLCHLFSVHFHSERVYIFFFGILPRPISLFSRIPWTFHQLYLGCRKEQRSHRNYLSFVEFGINFSSSSNLWDRKTECWSI